MPDLQRNKKILPCVIRLLLHNVLSPNLVVSNNSHLLLVIVFCESGILPEQRGMLVSASQFWGPKLEDLKSRS